MFQLPTSRLTNTAFYLHCFIYLTMLILVLYFNDFYFSMDREDGVIELTGAFCLFVTSIILAQAAKKCSSKIEKKNYQFYMLAFASVLFFWASGEELSWGQHIFGTVTPDWLAEINGQKETNIHNINKKFFDRWLERFTVLLALITCIQHFKGKEFFAGFRLPEYSLNMAFLLIPIYRKLQEFNNDVWHINFVIFWGYPILAIIKKDKRMLIHSFLFVFTTLSVFYVHHNNFELFRGVSNYYHEVRETVFSILTVFFALQLKRDIGDGLMPCPPHKKF